MKSASIMALALVGASAEQTSPIGKIISMLGDLETKILGEGDAAQKAFEEVSEFCSDRQKQVSFEVKTGTTNQEELKAVISKAAADITELEAQIGDLAAAIAKSSAELKEATTIRGKENKIFVGVEKDLVDTIDTLERASSIVSRAINKGSFTQLSGFQGLTTALKVLVEASAINSADGTKLSSLLQSYRTEEANEESEDDQDEEAGAPAAAAYEDQSGAILDLLGELQGKAEEELKSARESEEKTAHAFGLKKQALDDELKFTGTDLDEAKKSKAANEESKAVSEGDLTTTNKDLAEDEKTLRELHRDCTSKAADFEAETASKAEELKALGTAIKVIKETTSGSSLLQVSFLQIAQHDSAPLEAVHKIRDMAVADKSKRLAKLASRMESLLERSGSRGFGKIKKMIETMIAKLEDEAAGDATEKAFCDKALKENKEGKDDAQTEQDKLTVKLEQGVAAVDKLKEDVRVLGSELAQLASSQMEMDTLRSKENKVFKVTKTELDTGLDGLKAALGVLRDYYAAKEGGNKGAADGIIALLETCESDLAQGLAEVKAVEENAAADYGAETKDNEITKIMKTKDEEYKTKEIASLQKAGTEMKSDKAAVEAEIDALNESLESLEKQCVAKAETYEEKASRKKLEIQGLKAALESLAASSSFIQRNRKSHNLRHTAVHHA